VRTLPLLALLFAGQAGRAEPQISVTVNLVVLHASVTSPAGAAVTGLTATDFQVLEDRVPQTLRLFRHDDVPLSVGLVIDHSGSTRPKLGQVISAARAFVQLSSAEDELFVVNFNDAPALGLPASAAFSHDAEELARAIGSTPAEGMTALYDAIFLALQHLEFATRDKKVLLIFSDGADNASVHTLAEILELAGRANVMLYTVGLFEVADRSSNPGVLRRLAKTSGGDAYFPKRLSELNDVCARIARDLRNQYTLGYFSTSLAPPGVYRRIRVVAGKNSIRARPGYTPTLRTP
jgi:Ca-activated chloride channel family protein